MRELLEAGKEIARLEDENEELREKLRCLASGEKEAKRDFTRELVSQGIEAVKAVYSAQLARDAMEPAPDLELIRQLRVALDEESTARTEAEVKLARVEAELVDAKATADMWRDQQHRTEELRGRAEAQVAELSDKVRAEHTLAEAANERSSYLSRVLERSREEASSLSELEQAKHQKLVAVEAELVKLYEAKLTNTQRTQAVGDVLTKHFGYEVS